MKPIPKSEWDLMEAEAAIGSHKASWDDMAYLHTVLCQVGLPRRKVQGREFMRQSGAAWLNIQSGWLDEGRGPVRQLVPYGALPRLALAWITTFAVQNRTQQVPIGQSASQFLDKLNLDKQGRRYASLRKQMHALAACHVQLGYRGQTYSGVPIRKFSAWKSDHAAEGQRALWPGELILSEDFYKSLIKTAVPLDMRALTALKGSALAMDVYTWLAHRLWRIEGGKVALRWDALRNQFGQEYQGKDAGRDFKKEYLRALAKALAVYPEAQVIQVEGGLVLKISPPPISPRVHMP